MALPDDMNGLKQELSACTAAAKHASSLQVRITAISAADMTQLFAVPGSAVVADFAERLCSDDLA